jgi:CheY-like chemotaxis protein
MIERNVALEARLIDDLLDLTRIVNGKLALRTEPCCTHSLLRLVVEMVQSDAREKQIAISLELSAVRTELTGDPARLQQVFWNLLRNAVKFTPHGGRIVVRSFDQPPLPPHEAVTRICVQVSDDGIGFESEAAARIFEPFEQNASGPRFGGLGLGLAIARAVVEMHQGTIRAESPGPGCGATFTVELPGTNDPVGSAPSSAAGNSHLSEHEAPLRLLLVEDHAPTLLVLSRLLTRAGHQVSAAKSIAEARAAAATGAFDLVISDLGLPDGTGIDLMQQLQDAHGLRGIALSGYGTEDDLRRSQDAGFVAHLVKPVDINDLRRALRNVAKPGN